MFPVCLCVASALFGTQPMPPVQVEALGRSSTQPGPSRERSRDP
jgi:hypothetical protein